MTQTFTLTIAAGVVVHVLAEDGGRTWNGYAVPVLNAQQATLVGQMLGEHDWLPGESDGLCWEVAARCSFCGEPHTAVHSCEIR